ncbi:hypothetical protein GCM10023324_48770 [Streptomyces youssoufiensis]
MVVPAADGRSAGTDAHAGPGCRSCRGHGGPAAEVTRAPYIAPACRLARGREQDIVDMHAVCPGPYEARGPDGEVNFIGRCDCPCHLPRHLSTEKGA